MVTKVRTAAEAEEAILHAARMAFAQTGFAGTSIQQIAKSADVSTGLIYHYFKDKETLWRAVGDRAVQHYLEAAAAHGQQQTAGDPWERFVSLIRFGMKFALGHPENMRLRLWNMLSPSPHTAAQAIDDFFCATLTQLQQAGVVRGDLPAIALANYLSMTMRGWAESQVGRDCPPPTKNTLCPSDEQCLTLMLAPLRRA